MKQIALICAYNEEKHVREVVNNTLNYVNNVIVVNDGSRDNTLNELKKTEAIILNHETNKGKGEALKTGFKYCLDNKYDIIVLLDADGQHDPSEIPKLINKLNEDYDIVVGVRKRKGTSMKLIRRITNFLSSSIISLILKQKINDTQSGYRIIKSDILNNIELTLSKYDLESELLIKAVKKGYKIGEIEIKTIYGDEVSSIHPIKDVLRFFRMVYRALRW